MTEIGGGQVNRAVQVVIGVDTHQDEHVAVDSCLRHSGAYGCGQGWGQRATRQHVSANGPVLERRLVRSVAV